MFKRTEYDMRKRFKIQNKILLVMLVICFIPFLSFSVFVYHSYVENLQKNTEHNIFYNVEKNDKLVFYNLWLTENTIRYIVNDNDFCELMTERCSDDAFIGYIKKAIEPSQFVNGVVIFLDDKTYSYGYDVTNDDKVEFALQNRSSTNDINDIRWGGRKNDCMLVSTDIYDSEKKVKAIGKMYFLVGKEMFDDIAKEDEGIIFICDTLGNVIISNDDIIVPGSNIWTVSIEMNDFIYTSDNGSMEISIGGKDYLVAKYMSQFMDWYFVKLLDKEIYLRYIDILRVILLFAGLAVLVIIFIVYTFMIHKMFEPFNIINDAMRNVVADNFNISLDIHTNDEFETISNGFNKMVKEINNLLADIKKSNENRIKVEIEALQYQIDPHFLYNILAAVRFKALKDGSNEISDMLLKLNRLFRIKFREVGRDVPLVDDMNIMRDYTELWNLRYDNKIKFLFDVSEDAKQCNIPTLILQPLIENAIIHGVTSKVNANEEAVVKISAKYKQNYLELSVYDNGGRIDDDIIKSLLDGSYTGESGIGWSNLRKRLHYRYNTKAELDIKCEQGVYTEVLIRIYEHKIII